jgi:hypothetical protein
VSFAAITLCVASQRVLVVVYFIDSVRKLLDTPSYTFLLYRVTLKQAVSSVIAFTARFGISVTILLGYL